MPCCGITIEYIYARLKAAEIPGSGSADKLLDELLPAECRPQLETKVSDPLIKTGQTETSTTTAT